jgi:hypothetical protein
MRGDIVTFYSRSEFENYLASLNYEIGKCGIATYEGKSYPVYIVRYKNFCEDGSDYYLEAPVDVYRHEYKSKGEKRYLKNQLGCIFKDNYAYELEFPQTGPFLPRQFDFEAKSQEEILDWILVNKPEYCSHC